MADKNDPLASLLLDAEEVDRARLALALSSYVGIDKKTGRIVPKPDYAALTNEQRIFAVLLAAKAASLMGIRSTESIAAKDVPALAGIPVGSAPPTLKVMRESHTVSQTAEGLYYLNDHDVMNAVGVLEAVSGDSAAGPGATSSPSFTGARKSTAKKSTAKTSKDAGATKLAKGGGGGRTAKRVSPKAILVELIDDGYFDDWKSIADIITFVKDTKVTTLATGTLSPTLGRLVVSGGLVRRKNERKKYEYKKA